MLVRELHDYQFTKKVFYLHARNVGQNCLVNAVLHLRSELVIGEGQAGTGKTLLVLACAFQQIQDGTRSKVLITRDAVESAEKLGFLPGSLEAKVKHFLIGFEGNRTKLIALLDKDIAEKPARRSREVKLSQLTR
jgi:predicted ribonuclease YlaK